MSNRIDSLSAPLCVSWQLTHSCNLGCLHCCTSSAPGKARGAELDRDAALRLAGDILAAEVPYVMLMGGEPLTSPSFWPVAEKLGNGGVQLKVETNGQAFGPAQAERLSALPIRSVQVSVDGDTQEVYARQRPGASLEKAHAACRAVREAGMPLEITFAPTRINIEEAGAVVDRAEKLGAFRFNSGALMRLGSAAERWDSLCPTAAQYTAMKEMLARKEGELGSRLELCYLPFSEEEGVRESFEQPPAALLVKPDGRVPFSAFLEKTCAFLPRQTLAEAWDAYRSGWAELQAAGPAGSLQP